MKLHRLTLTAILALSLAAGMASAQDTTTVYVVHGIPGQDFPSLMLDPALPVDIEVSGLGCPISDFRFGDREGPLPIPAGDYDITIRLADETAGACGGAAVIELNDVTLPAGANTTLIAHRTADGSAGAGDLLELGITASGFSNDFTPTDRGRTRVIAHHTALAPTVEVVLSRDYSDPGAPSVSVPEFTNPSAESEAALSQINAEFRPGAWDVALQLDGAAVFGPDRLELAPFTAYYVYAVGDFFTGSFQYLIYGEDGLKAKRSSRPAARRGQARGR